jgi:hypothetical protein
MQTVAVLFALVSVAYAGVIAPALLNTGSSQQYRTQDNIGNYAFGYNEDHSTGGTFRRESGGPGFQQGSYGLRDADGRQRIVNYVADGLGFRANIQTNEPGVEPKDPAAVLINKAAPIVAAAPVVAAPVVAAPAIAPVASYAAPIAAPVAYAGYAAPAVVAHAPRAISSYSVATSHANVAAPLLGAYAAPAAAYAAPVAYGGYAAPHAYGHY